MTERRLEDLDREIAVRRRDVEQRLEDLRTAFAAEAGVAPRRRGWLLLLLAAGAGTALALRRGRRTEKKVRDVKPRRRRRGA